MYFLQMLMLTQGHNMHIIAVNADVFPEKVRCAGCRRWCVLRSKLCHLTRVSRWVSSWPATPPENSARKAAEPGGGPYTSTRE